MSNKKLVVLAILIITFSMGCSGTYAHIKNQPEDESKITQKELFDNWSDYDVWFKSAVVVFDPKNDDKKILVGGNWGTVKDQETWMAIVKANTTSDGDIDPVGANYSMTGVREIWGPENQLYGYVIHQQQDLVSATVVDENTMRLFYHRARFGGP